MKIIFLNKAVKSYVHFISDLLENPSDKKLNRQYLSLINWYYKYKSDKDFMRDLFLITENWDFNNNNFKIFPDTFRKRIKNHFKDIIYHHIRNTVFRELHFFRKSLL